MPSAASPGRSRRDQIDEAMIDPEVFSKHLYTRCYPDPDLLIRTSGEMRISNFLLWQLSYTEIYVTKKLWPDSRKADLLAAIEDYSTRQRRYGGLWISPLKKPAPLPLLPLALPLH